MKIFLCKGYNSFTNKTDFRVMDTIGQAKNYIVGLTDPKIYMFYAKTKNEAFNKALLSALNDKND